jgi:signal transduction histidine kinase
LIVEAHGGKLWLASAQPGATEFRFSLPSAPPAGAS